MLVESVRSYTFNQYNWSSNLLVVEIKSNNIIKVALKINYFSFDIANCEV